MVQFHQPEPDELLAGTYRLVGKLAQGGFASVWRATRIDSDEAVAIKFMLPTRMNDEATVKRFQREARLMLRLHHPHIVEVLDYGVTEHEDLGTVGLPYLVMELLSGQTLEQLLEDDPGPMSLDRAIAITAPILDALAEAHKMGIVHRDLKPDNIFIHRLDPPDVKLIDFGICKPLDTSPLLTGADQLTKTDQVFGTPDYMAPEQISAEPLSPATDIYAIGIILYELLCGRRPFVSKNVVKTMIMHLDDPMPPLAEPYRDHPIQALIERCTLKDPGARVRSAMELKQALLNLPPAPNDAVDRVRLLRDSRDSTPTPDTRILAKRRGQAADIGHLATLDAETPARLRPPPTMTPRTTRPADPAPAGTSRAIVIAIISAILACIIVGLLILR